MFRTWQVFIFSLVPLALVFTGLVIASLGGIDSSREPIPTPAPSTGAPAPPPAPPGASVVQLTASNLEYSTRTVSVQSAAPVTVQLDNRDAGVQHNFSVYNNQTLSQRIFIGDTVTGAAVMTYNFTAPPPGTYLFRCDVHPDTMSGTFTSR
jgi:plastocyanin